MFKFQDDAVQCYKVSGPKWNHICNELGLPLLPSSRPHAKPEAFPTFFVKFNKI